MRLIRTYQNDSGTTATGLKAEHEVHRKTHKNKHHHGNNNNNNNNNKTKKKKKKKKKKKQTKQYQTIIRVKVQHYLKKKRQNVLQTCRFSRRLLSKSDRHLT